MNAPEFVLFAVLLVIALIAFGSYTSRRGNGDNNREEKSLDLTSKRKEILNSVSAATENIEEAKELTSAIEEIFQIRETHSNEIQFRYSKGNDFSNTEALTFLREIWDPSFSEKPEVQGILAAPTFQAAPQALPAARISTEWFLVITKQFSKSIQKVDGKVKGRILTAINEIASNPISPKGNTIKPLTHDLQGLWRYRIGDYRLIYAPVERDRRVLLLNFSARGEAYAS